MRIEIYGLGCAKCKRQTKNVERAVRELGIDAEVVKVEDAQAIAEKGVMLTPAVAVDGRLRSSGRVAGVQELKDILSE